MVSVSTPNALRQRAESEASNDGLVARSYQPLKPAFNLLFYHSFTIPPHSSSQAMVTASTGIVIGVTLCLVPTVCSIAYALCTQKRKRRDKKSTMCPDPDMERENDRLERQRAVMESLPRQKEDATRPRTQLETDVEATVELMRANINKMPPARRKINSMGLVKDIQQEGSANEVSGAHCAQI
jgi:hypothetical protein